MSTNWRSVTALSVSVALLVPLSATGLAAAATPTAALTAETPTPLSQESPQTVRGQASPAPQFSIAVMQRDPARLGGSGVVDVVLTRRGGEERVVQGATVDLRVPAGTWIASASGKAWTCPKPAPQARTLQCERKGSIAATTSPAPISVQVKVGLAASGATPSIAVTARGAWRGDPAAKSSPWPAPWLVQDIGPLDVYPALDATLSSPAGTEIAILTRGGPEARQVVLAGAIDGIEGGQVAAEWFVKSGPKVRFLAPRAVLDAQSEINQVIEYPATLKGTTRSVIGLRVTSDDRTITRTVALTLRASQILGTVNGRDKRIAALAAASRIPIPFEDYVDADDDHIAIDGPIGPQQPGSTVNLSVRSKKGVPIESVAWYLVDDHDESAFVTSDRNATFTVPSQPGDAQAVQVAVVMANGETHEEGFILYALEESELRTSTRDVATTEDDTTANLAVFCSVATNVLDQRKAGTENPITIDPPGGVQLTFTPKEADISKVFADGNCKPDGAMSINGALLKHPSAWTFNGVEAKVDSTGLTVSTIGWNPPPLLQKVFFGKLKIEWKGTLTSPLTDGSWGLFGGSVDMQPVTILGQKVVYGPEFIPLPGDWSVPKDKTKLLFLNKADGAPADNTLRITEEFTGPKDGGATVTADAVAGSLDNVEVVVKNIVLGDNGQGDSFVATGSGRFNFNEDTSQRKVTLKVECYRDKVLSDNCELVDRLTLRSFNLVLADDTIGLTAEAAFRYADDQIFAFDVNGTYTDSKTWSLTGSSRDTWNLGQGLSMDDLVGTIERRPRGPAEPNETDLFVDVRGTLRGLTFGSAVTVDSLSARVTNQCAQEESACKPTEMRLQVDAALKAQLPGGKAPTPLNVRAAANLATLAFRFEGTAEDVAIGPEGMQVTKARFVLTNEATNTCRPKGAPAPTGNGYTTQIAGQVRVLNSDFTVTAQFNSDGYCLWGQRGEMPLGSEGLKATSGLLTFSNFPGGAQLDLGNPGQVVDVPVGKIQVSGDFQLPASVNEFLGTQGTVTYNAKVATNLTSAEFDLKLTTTDAIVLYEQTQASVGTDVRSKVTMSEVGLKVSYDVGNATASLEVYANGELTLPRQDRPTEASVTPLSVKGSFKFAAGKVDLEIGAAVRTSTGAVENAFGQPGLTIRTMAASLGMTLPAPSIKVALNADVTLPPTWGGSIGIKAGAPIKLGASLDLTAPCLVFAIGEEKQEARQVAVDLANLGVITAKYFKLVLAPAGCSLPTDGKAEVIKPGYAFAFDGEIMGSPTKLALQVELGKGLKIKGEVDVPKLNLYVVELSNFERNAGPKLWFDIDSEAKKYDIDIDAYLEVGKVEYGVGLMVAVKGSLRTSDKDFITAKLIGYAQGRLGPISVEIPQKRANGKPGIDVDLKIAKSGSGKDSQNMVNAGAELRLAVVGLTLAVEADLNYAEGQLVELKAVVNTSINIVVAKLQARVQFDLCQGTLSAMKQDNSGSQCTRFANLKGASPSIRVGVTGRYRILWWSKDYLWQAYDSVGKEGAAPTPDVPTPLDLATEIPEGVGDPMLQPAYVVRNHDVRAVYTGNQSFVPKEMFVKIIEGKSWSTDTPACDTARVGAQAWVPTTEMPNPPVEPQNVYPMQQGESCAMLAKASNAEGTRMRTWWIYCDATLCRPLGDDYRLVTRESTGGLSEDWVRTAARSQAFTGLTTPPGFLPSGGLLEKDGVNPAVVQGWDGRSELRADAFALKLVNAAGKAVWTFGSKPIESAVSSHFELRGTQGSAELIQFVQERPGWYAASMRVSFSVKKPAEGSTVNPMLVVSDGMFTVYDGEISGDRVLWGVKKDGTCFYNKERARESLTADFCKVT